MNPSSLQAPARPASVISAFMQEYSANFEFYKETSRVARKIFKKALKTQAIPIDGTILYRAKDPNSLEEKLQKRHKLCEYKTKDDIKADIVDICGIQICLTSTNSNDEDVVRDIVYDKFNVIGQKVHPDPSDLCRISSSNKSQEKGGYQKKFPPYNATHYHVHLKNQDQVQYNLGDAKGSIIEVQVRSPIHDQNAKREHSSYKSRLESNPDLDSTLDAMCGIAVVWDVLKGKSEREKAEQEAKENRVFETANDLGLFIDQWISKESGPWVKEPPVPTCNALLYLLRLEDFKSMNCQKEVRKQLQAAFGEESIRERISSLYEFAKLITIAFIVDTILLTDDGKPKVPLPTHKGIDKVHVIMNTIRWLNKLFKPSLTWTWVFDVSRERKMLLHGLDWLAYTGNRRQQNKEQLNAIDTMHLEALWSWFEAHEARQVQLTFTMSRCGINRQETDILMLQKLINGLAWLS